LAQIGGPLIRKYPAREEMVIFTPWAETIMPAAPQAIHTSRYPLYALTWVDQKQLYAKCDFQRCE